MSEATKKPWQRLNVRPQRPDVVVREGTPLAQITIYDDVTLLTRRSGATWRQYPISADALARSLGNVPSASGLLLDHTLGTGYIAGAPFYVVYIPAHMRTLRIVGMNDAPPQAYALPLPPLVWAGHATDYRIWALNTPAYPTKSGVSLMRAPFPNTYPNGTICWGTSDPVAPASPSALAKTLALFLEESYFNLHLTNGKSVAFPNSVVAQWQHIIDDGVLEYPLDDLMPAEYALGWVLSGAPWGAK